MRQLLPTLALLLLAPWPSWAAPGAPVPIDVTSVEVLLDMGNDQFLTSGPLPLSIPFPPTFGCSSQSGTASGGFVVSNPSGVLQVDLAGSLSMTGGCQISVIIQRGSPASFAVPDLGLPVTPVFLSLTATEESAGDIVLAFFNGPVTLVYPSALLPGSTADTGWGLPVCLGGCPPPPFTARGNELHHFIPNDFVAFESPFNSYMRLDFRGEGTGTLSGTLSGTYRLEAFLPPTAATVASLPSWGAPLVAGLLLGLSVRVLRKGGVAAG
jgi:hypothetical protein